MTEPNPNQQPGQATGQTGAPSGTGQPPVQVVFQAPGTQAPNPGQAPGSEDWEGRFKGLSRTHQELAESYKNLQTEAQQSQTALQQQLEEAQAQVALLSQQGEEATTTLEDMQLQMAVMEASQIKLNLLTETHPDLVPFHKFIPHVADDGTIQDEEGLKAAIEDFAKLISSKTDGAIQQFRQGHVPSPPGAAGRDGQLDDDARADILERTLGVRGYEKEAADHLSAWRQQHPGA